ncbi:MAG: alanyl-tRNA editing protein [Treponema sp.]|jgi:alanyl-tRNA synthetase|nr:alanyl-tRNA editing protein [Treponema sp.]
MPTQRAYYDYAGAEIFRTEIREVRPSAEAAASPAGEAGKTAVILDKTIFYPEGGGQSADRGTINGIPLADVREQDGEIIHLVAEGGDRLVPGPAELALDVRRRRDFTVQHTGQHLLSGTMLRMTGKPTVSMHLGEEFNTIDVDTPDLAPDTLAAVEEAVMDSIEEDCLVIIHLCPPEDITAFPLRKVPPQGEEVIRVVEIRGHDFSPCCGTHCFSTGQIGILRILGAEKYKGMIRVTFIAGRRCFRDSRLLRRNGEIISRSLKVPVGETGKAVLTLLEKTGKLERDLKALEEAAAETQAQALLEKAGLRPGAAPASGSVPLAVEIFPAAGIDEVLRIGRAAQKKTSACLVLASERDMKFAAFCPVKEYDVRLLVQEAMEKQGGKGGGGPGFFQGLFYSPEALRAFMAAVKN